MTKFKQLSKEVQPIIEKMCDMIDVEPESIDYGKEEWYYDHTWTQEQENEFFLWLKEYSIKKNLCLKHKAGKLAGMFILNYGWRTKRNL